MNCVNICALILLCLFGAWAMLDFRKPTPKQQGEDEMAEEMERIFRRKK